MSRWRASIALVTMLGALVLLAGGHPAACAAADDDLRAATLPLEPIRFAGRFFAGEGNLELLRRLETARRLLEPDPELPGLPLLYEADWNGFTAGSQWHGWWVPNSYGMALGVAPFALEPLSTFLANSQDLWFQNMGDGKREWTYDRSDWMGDSFTWTPPDGCLPDAANHLNAIHRQGDGNVGIHDWALESTAAAVLLQAELLLIERDLENIGPYLPLMQRAVYFIESRRDPETNLYLAGPAATLVGPAYGAFERFDGKRDRAFPAALSITYIAALDRLIELERLAGDEDRADVYSRARDGARQGLAALTNDDGTFIRWLDPDGVRHGIHGAHQFGYFPTVVNHDAVALRVVDDNQARRIVDAMLAVEGLRPHGVSVINYPSLEDMYWPAEGILEFGRWFNGGHWTSCEGRMIMACMRTGRFDFVAESLSRLLPMIERFQMDNPLPECGGARWFPDKPVVLTCDMYAAPTALLRGLFEYVYYAEGLRIIPHMPPSLTSLEQRFPVRLGPKRIYVSVAGRGAVDAVTVNGREWPNHDDQSVMLPFENIPKTALVRILLEDAVPEDIRSAEPASGEEFAHGAQELALKCGEFVAAPGEEELLEKAVAVHRFVETMDSEGLGQTAVGAHARLALQTLAALCERRGLLEAGSIESPDGETEKLIQETFALSAAELIVGLERVIEECEDSRDRDDRRVARLYRKAFK